MQETLHGLATQLPPSVQSSQSRAGLTVQKASALQALANIMRLGCHLRHAGGPAWPGNAAASVPSWHRQNRTALSVHPAAKAHPFLSRGQHDVRGKVKKCIITEHAWHKEIAGATSLLQCGQPRKLESNGSR